MGKTIRRKVIGFPYTASYQHIAERDSLLVDQDLPWKQIKKCSAWIVEYKPNKFALKSYNDVVALFDSDRNKMLVFGRYSRTTTRHIKKFYKYCFELMYPPIDVFNLGVDDYFAEME